MDWQTILTAGIGVGTSIVGWFVREIQKDIEAATRKQDADSQSLRLLQLDVAKNYVTHADLLDIKKSLQRIEDKLDNKADKSR